MGRLGSRSSLKGMIKGMNGLVDPGGIEAKATWESDQTWVQSVEGRNWPDRSQL
jgi:hypothetical protein